MIVEVAVGSGVVDHQRQRRARRRATGRPAAIAGLVGVERERQVADLQPVAVLQQLPALNQPAVDERAVAAVQVLDEVLLVVA